MSFLREINESFWFFWANHLPRLSLFNHFRSSFIALGGVKVGRNVTIWSGFDTRPIGCASNLIIGDNVFINRWFRCAIPDGVNVFIGDNCAIGPNVSIETVNHNALWTKEERWGGKGEQVIINERCWLGAGTIILGGVTIGPGSVVAAGAIVTGDVQPNVIVAGIPARPIKKLM